MAIYAYKCRTCGYERDTQVRGDTLGACPNEIREPRQCSRACHGFGRCSECNDEIMMDIIKPCRGELRRVFQVSLTPPMMPHFNTSVGKEISDMGAYKNALKKESDAYMARTGIPTDFRPVDMRDSAALGVTGEGLDDTNRVRHAKGLPDIKLT